MVIRYFDFSGFAERKIIWSFSVPATISGLLVIPVVWLGNALLVNQTNGYSELGLFNAANQWRQFIIIIPNILSNVMLPIFSESYGQENFSAFRKTLSINLKTTWSVALPACVAVIGFSWPLATLFGAQYEDSVPLIDLLMITAFLNILNNVVGTALAASGRMWTGTIFNLAWAIVLIVCAVFLTPIYGGKGLAFSYLIAYVLHSSWQMIYVELKMVRSSIVGQKWLILFSLITIIPISFLAKPLGNFYLYTSALVIISAFPFVHFGWDLMKKNMASDANWSEPIRWHIRELNFKRGTKPLEQEKGPRPESKGLHF
jgi:O-antigen/teichoic acid export membrane protein